MLPQGIGGGWRIAVVINAQTTPKVNVVNGNACRFNVDHQIKNAVHGVQIRRGFCNLRADVAIDAHHGQAWQGSCAFVSFNSPFVRNAKFVALEARRNVGVCLGVNVGVDAQTHGRFLTERQSNLVEHFQLCFAFDIEASNAKLECLFHFCACFADT